MIGATPVAINGVIIPAVNSVFYISLLAVIYKIIRALSDSNRRLFLEVLVFKTSAINHSTKYPLSISWLEESLKFPRKKISYNGG